MTRFHRTREVERGRRRWLAALLAAAGGVAATALPGARRAAAEPAAAGGSAHRRFIDEAFRMRDEATAAGDQGYGAVVVINGRVVGFGPSRVVTGVDPTAHAEMEAIRDAARRLGTRDLSGAVMYASSRPCRMCETGAYWANVSRVYHGRGGADAGAPGYSSC